jgi:mono/diheme cytochrome c family protein
MRVSVHQILTVWLATLALVATGQAAEKKADKNQPVSYYKQIRPIFQAQCQGCHQPAKPKGGYVMTEHAKMLAGGDSEGTAIVPKNPTASSLIKQITPKDGKAEMPKGTKPLHEVEIELITKWIAEGAIDDTPENAKERYDMANPPVYTRAPVVTALDYSSDGQYLAIAGFHEVLLHKADGSGLVARLVGLSERIEAVRFAGAHGRSAGLGCGEAQTGHLRARDL